MFVDESEQIVKDVKTTEEWMVEKLEEFKKFHPSYWMVGDITDKILQINLFGFTTSGLPKEKIKHIFGEEEKAMGKLYFAGVVCIYAVQPATPHNTSIVISIDSGLLIPVPGTFIIGSEDFTDIDVWTITGMSADVCTEAIKRIKINPGFEMISVMEP